ncbi:MAG: hypothetical protein QOH48_2394 [Actinomycetota bacterium]|jgi:hypothetical protein|nr:hypothetical protein [Actinomycetota bacterium]
MNLTFVRWIAFAIGIVTVVGTTGSVLRTLMVPRARTSRLSVIVGRKIVASFFRFVAARFKEYETKDQILALSAPISLLATLLAWIALYLIGYGLMLWPLIGTSLADALRESGSSMFTLGIFATPRLGATIINYLAAVTGLVVVALQIGYLPTLYSAFNRRETLVTLLQSRAGAPAWGPEILARAQLVYLTKSLRELYADWEHWAADVAESHTNYPVLIWFRSPHALRSWVVALLAVMDSAALYQSLAPEAAPAEARLVIRMGFSCLRNIADVMSISYDPDPFPDDPIQLTFDEYMDGIRRIQGIGFEMERTPEEAWPHFQGWRVNYETTAYAVADIVSAPPGPWSGQRSRLAGITIEPQRPADRRAGDPEAKKQPKSQRFGWKV